jgi:hypothetical protein
MRREPISGGRTRVIVVDLDLQLAVPRRTAICSSSQPCRKREIFVSPYVRDWYRTGEVDDLHLQPRCEAAGRKSPNGSKSPKYARPRGDLLVPAPPQHLRPQACRLDRLPEQRAEHERNACSRAG